MEGTASFRSAKKRGQDADKPTRCRGPVESSMAGAVRAGSWGRRDAVTGASHPEPRMELVLCPRGNRKLLRGRKQRGPFRRSPWKGGFSQSRTRLKRLSSSSMPCVEEPREEAMAVLMEMKAAPAWGWEERSGGQGEDWRSSSPHLEARADALWNNGWAKRRSRPRAQSE